jgi:hypothetical protein
VIPLARDLAGAKEPVPVVIDSTGLRRRRVAPAKAWRLRPAQLAQAASGGRPRQRRGPGIGSSTFRVDSTGSAGRSLPIAAGSLPDPATSVASGVGQPQAPPPQPAIASCRLGRTPRKRSAGGTIVAGAWPWPPPDAVRDAGRLRRDGRCQSHQQDDVFTVLRAAAVELAARVPALGETGPEPVLGADLRSPARRAQGLSRPGDTAAVSRHAPPEPNAAAGPAAPFGSRALAVGTAPCGCRRWHRASVGGRGRGDGSPHPSSPGSA